MGTYGEADLEARANQLMTSAKEIFDVLENAEKELNTIKDNVMNDFHGIYNDRCSDCLQWVIYQVIPMKDQLWTLINNEGWMKGVAQRWFEQNHYKFDPNKDGASSNYIPDWRENPETYYGGH